MIVSFRDKRTQGFAEGNRVKAFAGFERKAEMKLDQLDAATSLLDLELPGNRLEILKGDRKVANIASASMINGEFASSGRRRAQGR
jgi:proteic killer suppression protein